MNTFSKTLSMFLVVVMCFGLFATSAYASGFDLDDNSFADNSFAGSAADSFGGFDLPQAAQEPEVQAAPVIETEPVNQPETVVNQPEMPTANQNAGDFDLDAGEVTAPQAAQEDAFDLELDDTATFNAPFKSTDTDLNKENYYTRFATSDADGANVFSDSKLAADNFDGIFYTTTNTLTTSSTQLGTSNYHFETGKLIIHRDWLDKLADGTYYFWGSVYGSAPKKIGFIQVSGAASTDTYVFANNPYEKNNGAEIQVYLNPSARFDNKYAEFGYIAAGASSGGQRLSVNDWSFNSTGTVLTLKRNFLNALSDGVYTLIGFPTFNSTVGYVRMGNFTVKSGTATAKGNGTLSPDGQVWYSGTDPLTFYSNIFDAAGENWNYAGYGWDVIVPDIRVSTRSSMSGAVSVRVDQYWDLGYGYFMLGQNFLSSLSPEETYYMQVVDARHPNDLYSNVVSFRVGPTLRAIDTDKHVINSTRSLRFRSSSPVSEVYVGNIQLTDPADYGVSWDGKTVTLSFEFLNKRSAGNTYTIRVRTTDGNWASTTFQVLTTAQGSASPRTGDESNLGLWAAFLLLSGTAVVVLIPKLRKHDI